MNKGQESRLEGLPLTWEAATAATAASMAANRSTAATFTSCSWTMIRATSAVSGAVELGGASAPAFLSLATFPSALLHAQPKHKCGSASMQDPHAPPPLCTYLHQGQVAILQRILFIHPLEQQRNVGCGRVQLRSQVAGVLCRRGIGGHWAGGMPIMPSSYPICEPLCYNPHAAHMQQGQSSPPRPRALQAPRTRDSRLALLLCGNEEVALLDGHPRQSQRLARVGQLAAHLPHRAGSHRVSAGPILFGGPTPSPAWCKHIATPPAINPAQQQQVQAGMPVMPAAPHACQPQPATPRPPSPGSPA